MKVEVDIFEEDVEGDYGITLGLSVRCCRCGHTVGVAGTGDGSARYAGFRLSETCPNGESNLYDVDWWR